MIPDVVGRCGLCRTDDVEFLDSHYVPRSLYKLIRDVRFQNPHPVLIGGGKSRISSRQASDYFLCADCEDRFSKRGETVGGRPIPYPAACRPQAWAAASAAVLLDVLG